MSAAETAAPQHEEEATEGPGAAPLSIRSVSPSRKQRPASSVPEEIDALSEADLFLNFGRDAQAEDVLKEALASHPDNIPVQLKLLTIYANRKDVNAFSSIARQVKGSGDAAAWSQAAVLGYSIDPANPMYAEAQGAAAAAAAMLSESGKPPAVDMDVGFNIPMDMDITAAAPTAEPASSAMDFDVSVYDTAAPMDFDVTGSHPHVNEALLPDFDVTGGHPLAPPAFDVTGGQPAIGAGAMDFDVTSSHPDIAATQHLGFDVTGGHADVTATQHMDFDVTGSHPNVAAETSGGLGAMEFDLGAPAGGYSAEGGLDFEVSAGKPVESAPSDFGGLSFDISSAAPAAGSGGMDFEVNAPVFATQAATGEAHDFGALSFDLGAAPEGGGGLDMDISAGTSAEAAPSDFGALSFDISGAAPAAEPAPGLDFDVSAGKPAGLGGLSFDISAAEPSGGLGGLDFGASGGHAAFAGEPASIASTQVLDTGMDFDVSAPLEAAAPAARGGGMDFDLSSASSVVVPTGGGELAGLGGGIDLDLDTAATLSNAAIGQGVEQGMGGMDFDLGAAPEPTLDISASGMGLDLGAQGAGADAQAGEAGEVENKLELARAFHEMGDVDTARELLGEVLKEGNSRQVGAAQQLIQQL